MGGVENLKIFWKITKCPDEEIGKNSVNPWMIPRKIACKRFIFLKMVGL